MCCTQTVYAMDFKNILMQLVSWICRPRTHTVLSFICTPWSIYIVNILMQLVLRICMSHTHTVYGIDFKNILMQLVSFYVSYTDSVQHRL